MRKRKRGQELRKTTFFQITMFQIFCKFMNLIGPKQFWKKKLYNHFLTRLVVVSFLLQNWTTYDEILKTQEGLSVEGQLLCCQQGLGRKGSLSKWFETCPGKEDPPSEQVWTSSWVVVTFCPVCGQTDRQTRLKTLHARKLCMRVVKACQ